MKAVEIDAPPTIRHSEPLTLFNAAIIINNVYQQNLEPTQGGYIPKRIANKLRQQLKGLELLSPDGIDARLELLLTALNELGVLQLTPQVLHKEKPMYEPGPIMEVWARLDMVWQARQLVTHWTTSSYWPGITGANFLPPSDYMYSLNPKPGRGFLLQYLIDSLQECVWYDITSLLEDLRTQQPGIMRPRYNYYTKKQRDDFTKNKQEWMQAEGEIYIGMIVGALFELGLIDLGFEQTHLTFEGKATVNPSAIRLTEFGKQVFRSLPNNEKDAHKAAKKLLKEIAATVADPARKFIIQPNFELLLLEPDLPALYSVLPFVQVKQIGQSSTLQLTQNALLRGMRSGLNIDTVIQTLQTRCQNELPQNVAYSLRDWSKLYREATVSQVYLIEVPETLTEYIVTSEKFQKFKLRQIGPSALVIAGDSNLNILKSALEKEKIVVHTKGDFSMLDDDDEEFDDRYHYR
jgi:hypothetical protein